ncbi:MAG: hypothetical protein NVSMB49_23530 [Ktedonobacteraceae bacterium]
MRISDVIGLFAALIGSTATLLTAWAYIRSHRPPKGELFRAILAITVIMVGILSLAVFVSRSTIQVNGQNTISVPAPAVPGFIAPRGTTPTLAPTSISTTPPTLSPSPMVTPSLSPTLEPSPSSTSTLAPSPTPKPKKG